MLTRKQLLALWIGIGLSVSIALFPPWIEVQTYQLKNKDGGVYFGAGVFLEDWVGYYPLWATPTDPNCIGCAMRMRIDVLRLLLQWAVVWLSAAPDA